MKQYLTILLIILVIIPVNTVAEVRNLEVSITNIEVIVEKKSDETKFSFMIDVSINNPNREDFLVWFLAGREFETYVKSDANIEIINFNDLITTAYGVKYSSGVTMQNSEATLISKDSIDYLPDGKYDIGIVDRVSNDNIYYYNATLNIVNGSTDLKFDVDFSTLNPLFNNFYLYIFIGLLGLTIVFLVITYLRRRIKLVIN